MRRNATTIAAVSCVLLTSIIGALEPSGARALAGDPPPGVDISWPQCGHDYPASPIAFAVIGVTGGRPFTENECFAEQYRWAQAQIPGSPPAVYLNLDYPKPGRPEAATGPYGTCAADDAWCQAYNYGFASSRAAMDYVVRSGAAPSMWWLDVETENHWSDEPAYNAQAIRGALEYFRGQNLAVGIYSNSYQWRVIAGAYAPGGPLWTGGAQGLPDAQSRCVDADAVFAGGTVAMNQYYDFGFDTDLRCGADPAPRVALGLPDPVAGLRRLGTAGGVTGTMLSLLHRLTAHPR
jgi:hypothetical protein